jgi:hypothetical protein
MGAGWSAPFIQPGLHHSNQRKMLRRGIGPQRIGTYDSLIESAIAKLMATLETFEGNPNLVFQRYVEIINLSIYQAYWDLHLLQHLGQYSIEIDVWRETGQ